MNTNNIQQDKNKAVSPYRKAQGVSFKSLYSITAHYQMPPHQPLWFVMYNTHDDRIKEASL